ncbi:MAG: nickel-dependent lactate racemase [Eubacteriales bacterium]|nr:nickel-dependent lactate racemase [Eubacteriales bacterium]
MKLEYGFGKTTEYLEIEDSCLIKELMSNEMVHEHRGAEAVEVALENPIGKGKLEDLVKPGMKVAIVTSDISRPLPSYDVLPSVVKRLIKGGVRKEDITVVFALGSHRKHTEEEKKHLAGEEVYNLVKCEDSTDSGFVHMGETSHGTPVDVTRTVAEADFKICLGNIEFHYFAGYSGGYKAIMPGCSTKDAIQANHTMMTDDRSCAGNNIDNPLRRDIDEAGAICGVDYIVNAVLDEHKKIVYAVAGDPVEAHKVGCSYLDKMYRCEIPQRADIVVVSQGGAPKDANLYQTQKALDNSKHAVKDGGSIILIGECGEGFGSAIFEEWLRAAKSPDELVERINREFKLGGHKAAAIGMVEQKATIYLVSKMPEETVRDIFMVPCKSVQEAYDMIIAKKGKGQTVISMPFGGATLPIVRV